MLQLNSRASSDALRSATTAVLLGAAAATPALLTGSAPGPSLTLTRGGGWVLALHHQRIRCDPRLEHQRRGNDAVPEVDEPAAHALLPVLEQLLGQK